MPKTKILITNISNEEINDVLPIDHRELWTTLTKLCDARKVPYHSVKSAKFPFEHSGILFEQFEVRP